MYNALVHNHSIGLIQDRLALQLESSLILQEGSVLDHLMLAPTRVIELCSPLKAFNTLRSVEELSGIRMDNQKHSMVVQERLQ